MHGKMNFDFLIFCKVIDKVKYQYLNLVGLIFM